MTTYRVNSAAAGANNGTSWTDAYTSISSAFTAATADGDIILVHYTHQENFGVDTTLAAANNIAVICVNKDSSEAPTSMDTGGWIGSSSASIATNLDGAFSVFTSGLTIRMASTSAKTIRICGTDGGQYENENMYIWLGTGSGQRMMIGNTDAQSFVRMVNPTFRFGHASQYLKIAAAVELEGGSVTSAGSIPDSFLVADQSDPGGSTLTWDSGDLSVLTGNIVGNASTSAFRVELINCDLHASTTWLATQTTGNRSGAEIYLKDCHSGDVHTAIGHQNALGKTEIDLSIYFTSGAAGVSWKVTSTSAATFRTPYRTPWINWRQLAGATLTPHFEILRDGSATAYTDQQVWIEACGKITSGSVLTTFVHDRCTINASAANQGAGAGTGSWTGEGGTAWSGRIAASLGTTAEVGNVRARMAFAGGAGAICYMNPEIGDT